MKQRKRWLGLAAVPFALAFLAFAQPAHAADYAGDCASIPNHVTGNATVNDPGNCVIDTGATLIVDGTLTVDAVSVDVKSEIQSVGKVTIRTNPGGELKLRKKASSQNNDILLQSPQNRIETKGLEAGNSVQVDAGLNGAEGSTWDIKIDGQIIINKIQSSPTNPNIHGNVLLRAVGPISTKTIKTDGNLGAASLKSGGVQIEAYRNGGIAANSAEFVIGGDSAPNGVNGNIVTESTIGGGTSPSFVNGGVYVTMGGTTSTGNIRVFDASAIKVRATQSRSGWIILNARAGSIFLPAGTLSASGDTTNNSSAGLIYLLAKTLDTQPGTVIATNQTERAPGVAHQIFICVETLRYRGNGTDGLKILNDGDGGGGFFSLVNISPSGYLVPQNLTSNVNVMPWNFSLSSAELAKDGPLAFDGSEGNAPIVMRSDGNTAAVNVSGYPLSFSGGDVTIRSRGEILHRVNVGFFGSRTNKQGLVVNVVGNFIVDANGRSGAGGIVQVKADSSILTATTSTSDPTSGKIVFRADGPESGDGDGGTINLDLSAVDLFARGFISADAAPNGTGNAVKSTIGGTGPQAVIFTSGSSLALGTNIGKFRISAAGGSTGGNGGGVVVLTPGSSIITVSNSLSVDASAHGPVGDGGNIELNSATRVQFKDGDDFAETRLSLAASGGTFTGAGGRVLIPHVRGPSETINKRHLDVNSTILVDGGPSSATSVFDGSISLRSVTCRQYKTGFSTWPKRYWNCVSPDSPGAETIVRDTAFSIHPDIHKTELEVHRVQLYTMQNSSAWQNFFADTDTRPDNEIGLSATTDPPKDSATTTVFMQQNNGIANNQLVATTAHELGHQLDAFWGRVSNLGTWQTAFANDFSKNTSGYLDGETCTTVFLAATCNDPQYASKPNSEIFRLHFGLDQIDPSRRPAEMFADMFEHFQTNSQGSEYENAMEYLPEMKAYMLNAINNNNHP